MKFEVDATREEVAVLIHALRIGIDKFHELQAMHQHTAEESLSAEEAEWYEEEARGYVLREQIAERCISQLSLQAWPESMSSTSRSLIALREDELREALDASVDRAKAAHAALIAGREVSVGNEFADALVDCEPDEG